MSLITDNWRLKLLALGLAVLMLGAVAFSQNPETSKTLTVSLNYTVPPGLVLLNPPSKVPVTVSGLANVIASVSADNIVADIDASNATAGRGVKLNVKVTAPSNVIFQNPAPIAVDIDSMQDKVLPVSVNPPRAAPTWSITTAVAVCATNPCTVTFTGPATWEVNLTASVVYSSVVNVSTIDEPNETVLLQNSNGPLDLSAVRTIPAAGLDVSAVSIHIEAKPGSTSSTVPLVDSPPSQAPPTGYRVTGIEISPVTVVITGDVVAVGRIQRITLPPVDLTGHISDFTIQVPIKYPDGVSSTVNIAKITYLISPNPNVTPSP